MSKMSLDSDKTDRTENSRTEVSFYVFSHFSSFRPFVLNVVFFCVNFLKDKVNKHFPRTQIF